MQAMGGGLGFVNYIALGTLIADFLKSVVLIILFIQGIRLINFIIKNKGLSVINIIEKDDSLNKTIKENLKEDILYASGKTIEEKVDEIDEIEKEIEDNIES